MPQHRACCRSWTAPLLRLCFARWSLSALFPAPRRERIPSEPIEKCPLPRGFWPAFPSLVLRAGCIHHLHVVHDDLWLQTKGLEGAGYDCAGAACPAGTVHSHPFTGEDTRYDERDCIADASFLMIGSARVDPAGQIMKVGGIEYRERRGVVDGSLIGETHNVPI